MRLAVATTTALAWLSALCFRSTTAAQASNSISLHPASIPIAVRTPYLSAWLNTLANASTIPEELPPLNFWTGREVGLIGLIKVDGKTYQWMGIAGVEPVEVLEWHITPTQTAFKLRAGPVDFTANFLSPVEPTDWARMSMPFSYLSMDIAAQDGREHTVSVYVDVTGEWIAPNSTESTFASVTRTTKSVYYSMQHAEPASMVERSEMTTDGTLVLAAVNGNLVYSQNGPSAGVRSTFDQRGFLNGEENSAQLPIAPGFPVMAISIDLATITNTATPTPVVFALGLVRDPVIEYHEDSTRSQMRRPYFYTKWPTLQEAVDAFLEDFPSALSRADELDTKIMNAARSTGNEDYADIVALSIRQTMAAIELTVPGLDGKLDAGDVKAFMKDVGETGRVNPMEGLYASLPALLYLDPSLLGALISPLLEAQALESYPHSYAAPDMGLGYPKATRNETDTGALGVDSSSTMLIVAYLHASKSGEGALLKAHYTLFKKWADFLVDKALNPTQSETSDGLTANNNANLALKGILALHAMSKISEAVAETADAAGYSDKARSYYGQWQTLGFVGGRVLSSYDQSGSSALAYNLYAAKLLGADFVANEVYEGQTTFLRSQLSSVGPYGVGYDSNDNFRVKSHWMMFTAATMTDNGVRDGLVSAIHNRTFMDGITPPFASTWDGRSGRTLSGRASPAAGSMLSFLALNVPNVPIRLDVGGGSTGDQGSPGASNSSSSKSNLAPIVGGVVGGVAALLIIALAFVLWKRKKQQRQPEEASEISEGKDLVGANDSSGAPLPTLAVTQTSPRSPSPDASFPSPSPEGQAQLQASSTAPRVFVKSGLPQSSIQTTSLRTQPSGGLSYASPVSGSGNPPGNASFSTSPTTSSSKGQPIQSSVSAVEHQAQGGEGNDDLRAEVLALRREMESLRAQQALNAARGGIDGDDVPVEPPPSYSH